MNIGLSSTRISFLLIGALLVTTVPLTAQQPSQPSAAVAPLPVYDAVSIRENKSGTNNVRVQTMEATLVATNVGLRNLVSMAYDIRPTLISGLAGWADSTSFDISAKVSDPDIAALKKLSREQRHTMLRAVLADRFHLTAHVETKILPVYELVIAKGGSKLEESTTPRDQSTPSPSGLKPGSMMISNDQMTAVAVPIANLAQNLAYHVDRTVIDKTALHRQVQLHPQVEAG